MKKVIALCIIIFELIFSTTCLANGRMGEYQVKAGFLYNFLLFAEWPEEAFANDEDTIIIGILGKDPFGETFKKIEGQTVDGRRLVIKRFRQSDTPEALRQCQLLFISPSMKGRFGKILALLKNLPVITVSEVSNAAREGVMINFIRKKDRVAFEINRAAAERAGIRLRSKLLRLSIRVID